MDASADLATDYCFRPLHFREAASVASRASFVGDVGCHQWRAGGCADGVCVLA